MENEVMKSNNSTRQRVLLLLLVSLTCFQLISGQRSCPISCLCYLDHEPRKIVCSNQAIQNYPQNISDLVQHLDISNNLLGKVPDELNQLRDLVYLSLAKNKLTSLPGDLQQLTQLQKLDLSENDIIDVDDIISISHLTNLKALYLAANPITSLDGLTSSAVRALDVRRCSISSITNTSLLGLPELVTLSLEGNPLKSIQRLTSEKLRWLDLSDCFLNYLSPDTFEGAPDLEQLRLANNPRLVYSSRHETLKHNNLKRLDVSRCNLDRPGLHGLTTLTHAVLSHNVIRMLPDRIFAKNRMLAQLHLNANGLNSVNRSSFAGLIKLEALDLSSNNLAQLHPSTFRETMNLRLLNLSFNDFERFPNIMSSLVTLDLTANSIQTIPRDFLTNMPRIRTLDLSDNRLESISDNFESESLRTLILKRNRLVELANNSFSQLPELQKLDLSGNRLTEGINVEVFKSNEHFRTVLMEDNPWRCDCQQLYQTFQYLTELPGKTLARSLICQSPSNVSGYTWESACFNAWRSENYYNKDRTWGIVMITFLILILVFGSTVTLRHTLSVKRQARRERTRLEQEEARERLRLLRRRNLDLEQAVRSASEPRIHPLELINPPPYEEAVQMPRLAQSLDALDSISMDPIAGQVIGSMESLRSRKRRRRPRNRARSEENLSRREDRQPNRRVRSAPRRNYSTSVLTEATRTVSGRIETARSSTAPRPVTTIVNRRDTESEEPSSDSKRRPRPQTPNAKRKRRRHPLNNGHSTDDEDSDIQNCVTNREVDAKKPIVIRELPREPRSGYRPNVQEHVV